MKFDTETYDLISQLIMSVVPTIILSGLLYTLLKTFVSNLKDYIMLRWDSLGVGSRVIYKDYEAVIQDISFRKITLLTENKLIMVPSTEWSKMAIVIPVRSASSEETD